METVQPDFNSIAPRSRLAAAAPAAVPLAFLKTITSEP